MKWLSRVFWLLAWGAWLWLGFGLHRELPRGLGTVVFKSPPGTLLLPVGFLDGEPTLVLGEFTKGAQSRLGFQIWDVKSGKLLRRIPMESMPDAVTRVNFSSRHAKLIVFQRAPNVRGRFRATSIDVRNERRVSLGETPFLSVFHPTKPWVALYDHSIPPASAETVVIDLESGRRLLDRRSDRTFKELVGQPLFTGDSQIAIPRSAAVGGVGSRSVALEMWMLPSTETPARVDRIIGFGTPADFAASDRMTWQDEGGRGAVHVYDAAKGRAAFSFALQSDDDVAVSRDWPGSEISRDGRTVFSKWWMKLWDVDTGRLLWSARNREGPLSVQERYPSIDPAGCFTIQEFWSLALPNSKWETKSYAVRDLRSGRLVCRMRQSKEYFLSSDGRYLYDLALGGVRSFPPPPNYPLLAVCQTILALPLVLLWALLCWRRKRKQTT